MENNSFLLRATSGEPRASTAVPVEQRPRNLPVRRIFSSPGQLEDHISRINDTSSFLNDDSALRRPFSSSRFAAIPIASAEVPGAEPDERASLPQSQDNLSGQHSLHENRTEKSDSQEDQGSDSQLSTPVISSYSDIQEFIDSFWSLRQLPERFQDGFDRMNDDIQITTSELSKEKRRSSRLARDVEALQEQRSSLSRDLEALRQELGEVQAREKKAKIQIANQDKALKVESSNVERLQQENEMLKELSRRDHDESEKTQSEMKQEMDALSRDLKLAKLDIRDKDKFVGQIERDVKNAKILFDEEVKRREEAETESNALKQECNELQASYREAKSQWTVLEEENAVRMTKLEGISESQREKISVLEVAVEQQKDKTQAVESDLVEMVSFLRRISRAVGQLFRATSIHGCLSVPVTVDFPVSAFILEEQEESYDIFERLVEALDCGSSLPDVLQLANPYDDALKDFFRILVVRIVAQKEYIRTKDETLRQIESRNKLIRARLQEQRRGLQELVANFPSQMRTMRQETVQSTEQLCLKVKQVKDEKERLKLELQTEKSKSRVITSILGKLKESLLHGKATLLDLKEKTAAHYQESKSRISENATETSSSLVTLEELKRGIESLFQACSVSREKCKTAEDNLQTDLERLRIALADREEKTKELMKRETDLRRAQIELSSQLRQAIVDVEEVERRTASLKGEMEKLVTEKNEVASKLTNAEQARKRMSESLAEALSAKRVAMKELIQEKRVVKQLRSELSEMSGKGRDKSTERDSPLGKDAQKVISRHLRDKIRESSGGELGRIQEASVEKGKCSLPSLTTRRTSSTGVHRESPEAEADPSDDDFAPPPKKKRILNSHPRKSPRQKTTRNDAFSPLTAGKSTQRQNPKEVLGSKGSGQTPAKVHGAPSKSESPEADPLDDDEVLGSNESVQTPAKVHGAPSQSGEARDEEWDVEVDLGKGEE